MKVSRFPFALKKIEFPIKINQFPLKLNHLPLKGIAGEFPLLLIHLSIKGIEEFSKEGEISHWLFCLLLVYLVFL